LLRGISDRSVAVTFYLFLAELNLDDIIEYSPLFVASRVFAVLASVWGGLAFVGLLLVVCSCFARWKTRGALVLSVLCVLAALCQGLSFLLLDSNMCTVVYANDYYSAGVNSTSVAVNVTSSAANVSVSVSPPPPTTTSDSPDEWVESVSCGPSIGMRLAIAAIVLYCVGALLSIRSVPVTITSDPFHRLPGEAEDVAGKDEDGNEILLEEKTADFAAAASRREIAGGGPVPELDEADGDAAPRRPVSA
jgi:hypothetical protein